MDYYFDHERLKVYQLARRFNRELHTVLFYHIARASATECGASLDELVDIAILAEPAALRLKGVLYQIIAMLIAMIRSLEQRPRQDMSR